ncbi:conserved Plasmodium protein, unknown function [Plasmodium ovale]|uniref:DNA-directed RNA polymerase III subunit RPC3 n=2 Tax=Plasmodium ovale TaxID=36330 RepID=A0A1D3TIK8_PLAOA|nr:conserved Plasmodium protein, unknown function [Plasmodium ovale]
MIKYELDYLKYIICDVFGHSCSEIVELILIYGNKLTINEIITLSNYEFTIVRNVLLCLLIHNIVDINIVYNKSTECSHVVVDSTKGSEIPGGENQSENIFPHNNGKTQAEIPPMISAVLAGKGEPEDVLKDEMNFLSDNENYKYMKGCRCASCICKIKRVEYFVIIRNIYVLIRYSSILYYIHPTRIRDREKNTMENAQGTNNASVTEPKSTFNPVLKEFNFFEDDSRDDYTDWTDDDMTYEHKDNSLYNEEFEKKDIRKYIEKVLLLRIIKNGRITIDNCLRNIRQDDYVEVCRKEIPNISRKKLRLIFFKLLKKRLIKKCTYFNEHICENSKNSNEPFSTFERSFNYINVDNLQQYGCNDFTSEFHMNGMTNQTIKSSSNNFEEEKNDLYKGKDSFHTGYETNDKKNISSDNPLHEMNSHINNDTENGMSEFLFSGKKNLSTNINGKNVLPQRNIKNNRQSSSTSKGIINNTSSTKRRRKSRSDKENGELVCFPSSIKNEDTCSKIKKNEYDKKDSSSRSLCTRDEKSENDIVDIGEILWGTSLSQMGNVESERQTSISREARLKGKKKEAEVQAEVVAEGMVAEGVVAEGVVAEGMVAEGVVAEGVVAEGVVAEGVVAEGVVAEGMVTEAVMKKANAKCKNKFTHPLHNNENDKENIQNNILDNLDNPFTYFQVNNETLINLYLKQECFNFICNHYNFNEIIKCIFFFLLKHVQINYSEEKKKYIDTISYISFENIKIWVIKKLKNKYNIYINENIILQNLNILIKYPENFICTKYNNIIINYGINFINIKNFYKHKIISYMIENMNDIESLRIWNFLISFPDEKLNDELISENVLIPLSDVRKKLYNLLYYGFIKCHECNTTCNNKNYFKHCLFFSTNYNYSFNKIKEYLFTIAKNIFIRKFYENNEINTLHNKSTICVYDNTGIDYDNFFTKDNINCSIFNENNTNGGNINYNNLFGNMEKHTITLTDREYAVDYLEISLIHLDKLIFIFNS